ncbi:hypothetical protein Droror1_Dr00021432 [Drosera rotundifolia]
MFAALVDSWDDIEPISKGMQVASLIGWPVGHHNKEKKSRICKQRICHQCYAITLIYVSLNSVGRKPTWNYMRKNEVRDNGQKSNPVTKLSTATIAMRSRSSKSHLCRRI